MRMEESLFANKTLGLETQNKTTLWSALLLGL